MSGPPKYMTPGGYRALVEELERLGADRQVTVKGVAEAAAEGDRSENAEYIYGKKRLRQIDSRMRFLRKLVEAAQVIDPAIDRGDRVYFGATVEVEDEEGRVFTYQLVGEHEADADHDRISYRSPVGAALMRRSEDDQVVVHTPSGKRRLTILEIRYE